MPKRSLEKLEKQYNLARNISIIVISGVILISVGVGKKLILKKGDVNRAIPILESNRAHLEKQYFGLGRIINRQEILRITRKITRSAGR